MSKIFTVTKKELWGYFSTPTALIFLGTYLFVNLFTFFWVEKFFSRNIADLRPLFEWMPILLVFLIATLTMKMWSEERRVGTIESLMTLPVKTSELVFGKFFACMALVLVAFLLTLGLVFTIAILGSGSVDWGPVIAAYVASLLLASAYVSIGLYVSSKTDSQIISLIITSLVCMSFYILGSEVVLGLFGNQGSDILKALGTGSRFSSISRGILDFRDIYYYLSITGVFLSLNIFSLERLKWSEESPKHNHFLNKSLLTLFIINLVIANVWLKDVRFLRQDITKDRRFSISEATQDILSQLQEPLLIRGYFSERTHPLLAPLVPTIRDLMQEYQNVGKGKVLVEVVDPRENESIEAEANRKYNIEPVPFQIADRHSASMVNSYFNIVIQYGDKFKVLNFGDLIAVKHDGGSKIDVELKNLEYDITSSLKKLLYEFNNTDNFFSSLDHNIKFVAYVSESQLPEQLVDLNTQIKKSLEDYVKASGSRLEVEYKDPSQDESMAEEIATKFGFKPQALSIFAQDTFYFYLTLQDGDKVYSLGVPEDLKIENFKTSMDATLKKMTPGFLRTVGLYTPPSPQMNPMMAQYGMQQPRGKQFRAIEQKLGDNYRTQAIDLDSGIIDPDVDIVMILAPKDLTEKQIFTIDQYLMRGATVILASSSISVSKDHQGFSSDNYNSGLSDWLAHHGVEIPNELVLDEQNSGFPSMRKRNVQGVTIREPYLAPYPFFIDVRDSGLNQDLGITSSLGQATFAWSSPLIINAEKNKERKTIELVKSSQNSWTTSDISIEANHDMYPELGFSVGENKDSFVLGAMIEGKFESFFKGKKAPIGEDESKNKEADENGQKEETKPLVVTTVVERSPEIARLIIYSSNEVFSDDTLQISSMLNGTQYLNSLQILENSVDWSTQDRDLLSMRSQSYFAKTLVPLTDDQKQKWEILNYIFALLGLFMVYGLYRTMQNKAAREYKKLNLA